jgi:hypothetical protein
MAATVFAATMTVVGAQTAVTVSSEAIPAALAGSGGLVAPLLLIDTQVRGALAGAGSMVAPATAIELIADPLRTNYVRNNSGQGAVPGTPGTLPTNWSLPNTAIQAPTVVGTGTENGLDYVDIQINTGATNNDSAFAFFFWEGQSGAGMPVLQQITSSVYSKVVAGSVGGANVQIKLRAWPGPVDVSTNIGAPFGSGTSLIDDRIVVSRATAPAGTTDFTSFLQFSGLSTTAPLNFTVRIGSSQIEAGLYATDNVRTTGSTASAGGLAPSFVMTADFVPEQFVSAVCAGAGSLAASLVTGEAVRATMAPAGTLTADVIPEQFVSATFAPAGSLVAPLLVVDAQSRANLAPVGAMTSSLLAVEQVVATFAPAGAMVGAVLPQQFPTATLAPSGLLTAALAASEQVTLSLVPSGTLSVSLVAAELGRAAFSGTGAMTADALPEQFLSAIFAPVGQIVAALLDSEQIAPSTFALAGSLTAKFTESVQSAASLNLGGLLAASVLPEQFVAATMAPSGTLAAGLSAREIGTATFAGIGTLTASASVPLAGPSADFSVAGSMTADVLPEQYVVAAFSGSVSLAAFSVLLEPAAALFSGAIVVAGDVLAQQFLSSEFALAGALTTTTPQGGVESDLTGEFQMLADAFPEQPAAATMEISGFVTAHLGRMVMIGDFPRSISGRAELRQLDGGDPLRRSAADSQLRQLGGGPAGNRSASAGRPQRVSEDLVG